MRNVWNTKNMYIYLFPSEGNSLWFTYSWMYAQWFFIWFKVQLDVVWTARQLECITEVASNVTGIGLLSSLYITNDIHAINMSADAHLLMPCSETPWWCISLHPSSFYQISHYGFVLRQQLFQIKFQLSFSTFSTETFDAPYSGTNVFRCCYTLPYY